MQSDTGGGLEVVLGFLVVGGWVGAGVTLHTVSVGLRFVSPDRNRKSTAAAAVQTVDESQRGG